MRLLVCGGRDYIDQKRVNEVLDLIHKKHHISMVIHGAAKGADTCASIWAKSRKVLEQPFPANWLTHGKAAGPIRNALMLDKGRPDLIVAFPGNGGTSDMIKRANIVGIRIEQPEP